MRVNFYGSHNSRYFLGLEGREMFLLRDYREAWKKSIAYTNFEVVGVGNNGLVVVKADEGIILFSPDAGVPETIIPEFEKTVLLQNDVVLGDIALDQTGTKLCIEKVTMQSKLSEKIFKILASTPRQQKGQAQHELVFYEIGSGKQKVFYKFTVDRKIPHAFSWKISPNFFYIIWGEAQKVYKGMETRFSVADLRSDNVFDHFVLEGLTEWILDVNNFGPTLVDSPQKSATRKLIVSTVEGDKHTLTISNEFAVAHLGKNFVAFQSRMEPRFLFKRFDDSVIQEVDLGALESLRMEYQVIFNEKDDIDFIASKSGNIKVLHSNMERFSIDARRWEIMAEQQKIDVEIAERKEVLDAKEKDLKEKRTKMKTEELMKTARKKMKTKKKEKNVALDKKIKELDDLKYKFMSSQIGKYEYVKKKKKIEKEIRELQGASASTDGKTKKIQAPLTSPFTGKARTIKPEVTVTIPPTEEVKLEEELKKYIPTVMDEEEDTSHRKKIKIASPFDSGPLPDTDKLAPKAQEPPRPKKKVKVIPRRLELPVSEKSDKTAKKRKVSPLRPVQKAAPEQEVKVTLTEEKVSFREPAVSRPEPPTVLERTFPQVADEGFKPMPDAFDETFEHGPKTSPAARKPAPVEKPKVQLRPKISVTQKPPVVEDAVEGTAMYEEDFQELPDTAPAPEGMVEGTGLYEEDFQEIEAPPEPYKHIETFPTAEVEIGPGFGVTEEDADDEQQRILEIKKQIEREIQEAISRRKESSDRETEQRRKYQKLLRELEESYKTGGISKANYLRLRKKYESRIEKFS